MTAKRESEVSLTTNALKPLNDKQKLFGRELGLAIIEGRRPEDAYEKAGYSRHRRNAYRLAADKRVQAIADEMATEALRLSGLHLGYLQAKAKSLFELNATKTFYEHDPESKRMVLRDLSAIADDQTWAISKIKMDPDTGAVTEIEVPDKLAVFNALIKTMPKGLAPVRVEAAGKDGGPIQMVDLSKATPEQLNALETIFGPLAGASGDDEGDPGGTATPAG